MNEHVAADLLRKLLNEGQIEYAPSLSASFKDGPFQWPAILRGLRGAVELTDVEEAFISQLMVSV